MSYSAASPSSICGLKIAFLEFQTAVEEIFDVQILRGMRFPEVLDSNKKRFTIRLSSLPKDSTGQNLGCEANLSVG